MSDLFLGADKGRTCLGLIQSSAELAEILLFFVTVGSAWHTYK